LSRQLTLCVFLQMSLNVQANMIQSRNGQSQSEREHSKPRGRFTGQRLKLLRPETYRQAVELLAEPREQVPYDHICRLLHVSEHTLKAIEASESLSIAERKERLLAKAWRLANKAIDRVEESNRRRQHHAGHCRVWSKYGQDNAPARGTWRWSPPASESVIHR
jgi:hypothetical protein